MLINCILFILTSDNNKPSNEKNRNCKKDNGKCLCDECFELYQRTWNQREQVLREKFNKFYEERAEEMKREEKRLLAEQRRRQLQANEGWIRWFVRKFFEMFSSAAAETEITEEPENSTETPNNDTCDEKEEDESTADD